MRRLGQALGILGVAAAAAACGSGGSSTIPSQPAAPMSSAAVDHVQLAAMRLRLEDLGPNWRREAPSSSTSKCDPHPKGVKITAGSWKSRGVDYGFGTTAQIHSDAIVFASAADAQKTVDANMKASVIRCVKHELTKQFRKTAKSLKLLGISSSVLRRHQVGDGLSGIRITLNVAKGKARYKFFLDAFLVRDDRALAEFTYMNAFQPAPISTEYGLAETIAQRGALIQQ
jgi:hypothetical protein